MKVFEYPDTEDGVLTYRVREDGSLLIAGMKRETDHAWIYIEKTGELLEYDEQVRTGMTHAMIGLGTHSVVVVDIYANNRYLCHTWDFTEKLKQGEGKS